MQERDLKILSFLTMCRICTRKQVQELLFPDIHENIPLRRLKKLSDEGYINISICCRNCFRFSYKFWNVCVDFL